MNLTVLIVEADGVYSPLPLTSETSQATVKRPTRKKKPPPPTQTIEVESSSDSDDPNAYQALPAHAGTPAGKYSLCFLIVFLDFLF